MHFTNGSSHRETHVYSILYMNINFKQINNDDVYYLQNHFNIDSYIVTDTLRRLN